MNKFISVIMLLTLIVMMVACGPKPVSNEGSQPSETTTEAEEKQDDKGEEGTEEGTEELEQDRAEGRITFDGEAIPLDKLTEAVLKLDKNIASMTDDEMYESFDHIMMLQGELQTNYYELLLEKIGNYEVLDALYEPEKFEALSKEQQAIMKEVQNRGYVIYNGEGDMYLAEDNSYFLHLYKDYLSEDMTAYMEIVRKEVYVMAISDAALMISHDDLAQRALKAEQFLLEYGNSRYYDQIKNHYSGYLYLYLCGIDNSPVADYGSKEIYPEVKASYEDTIERHGDTLVGQLTKYSLDKIKASENKVTMDMLSDLEAIIERITASDIEALINSDELNNLLKNSEETDAPADVIGDIDQPEPYPQYTFNKAYSIDLDGDGKKDSLEYTILDGDEGSILRVNDATLKYDYYPDFYTDVFRVIDIDKEDPYKEIVVCGPGPSADPYSEFFYYDGTSIEQVGIVEGNLKVGPYDSEVYIEGSGSVIAPRRLTVFNGLSHEATYTLDDEHKLTLVESKDGIYYIDFTATTADTIKVYAQKSIDGEHLEIEAGEELRFHETDNKAWIAAYWDGKEVWIHTKEVDYFQFTGLPFFD